MKILDQWLSLVYRGKDHMEVYANLALGHLPAFGENFNNSLISNSSSSLKAKVIKTLVGGIGETLRYKLLLKDQ